MDIEQIKAQGKCCITGKPLATSKHLNMVQLMCKATWQFPVWGHLTSGHEQMAVAYIHDDAIGGDGELISPVLFAIETVDTEIIYHGVSTLEEI